MKTRLRNYEYIALQEDIVKLIRIFKMIRYDQIHVYQSILRRVDMARPDKTKDMMRNLASEYHFVANDAIEMYAESLDAIGNGRSIDPFWLYCDFLQARRAGALSDTEIPYTSFVFELADTRDVMEVVVVPEDKMEVEMMCMELKQYDDSVADNQIYDTEKKTYERGESADALTEVLRVHPRKRLVIIPDKSYAPLVTVNHIHRFCIVDVDGFVNYYHPDSLVEME